MLKKYSEEIMKKLLILILSSFLLSSCILIPEILPTSLPNSSTQINGTLISTETLETPPLDTDTPIPTATIAATNTTIPTKVPTETNIPEPTATPFPFTLQSGSNPAYIKNFAHPSEGCNWMGIVGRVFDGDGKPLINRIVLVTGKIEGRVVEIAGVTGVPEADIYGPGGFEIQISDHVLASEKTLTIQIFDINGIPISDSIPFVTYADCGKNLIVINFVHRE